jgi:hypothetical protein
MQQIVLALLTVLTVGAQLRGGQGPPADPQSPATPAPAVTTQQVNAETDESAIRIATAVLQDVARTYREAPVLRDEISIVRTVTGQTSTQTISLVLGPGTDARIQQRGHALVASGPDVFVARIGVGDKYFRTELQDNLDATLTRTPGGFGRPTIPDLALRYGQGDPVDAFNLNMPLRLAISGYRATEHDGTQIHEVSFDSISAEGAAMIDAGTNLIREINLRIGPRQHRRHSATILRLQLNPSISQALDEPIAFATAGRRRVERINELMRLEGEVVGDASFLTPEGEVVRLADRRGSIIVLYFWSTRCQVCKRGLERLNEVHRWGLATGGRVECFGVLCCSGGTTQQQRDFAAGKWAEAPHTFSVLIDPDDVLADAIGIKDDRRIALIGPDGTLAAVLDDEGAATEAVLKQRIGVLLGPVPGQESQR